MKAFVTVVLCLCVPALAHADDRLALEQGADLETAHRIENATAAGVTAGLLGYESFELIRMAYETKPGGGYVDLSGLGKAFGYGLGTVAGIGSIAMVGLAIHDVSSTPVADARDAYRAGDHTAGWALSDQGLTRAQRMKRAFAWANLALDLGLAGYGLSQIGAEGDHGAGLASVWVGGTCALVVGTYLLHTREPVEVRTHRRLAMSASPGGIALAGTF